MYTTLLYILKSNCFSAMFTSVTPSVYIARSYAATMSLFLSKRQHTLLNFFYSLILLQLKNADFVKVFQPNWVLFMHKTPELLRALPPAPPPQLHFSLLRPFLSAPIAVQIIFLEWSLSIIPALNNGGRFDETSRIFCGHNNFPEMNGGISVCEKTK